MLPNFSQGNFFNLKLDFNNFPDLHEKVKILLANPKVKEKRRRNLANFIFNRTLQQSTYFDFFSQDSIKSLVLAKKIAQILNGGGHKKAAGFTADGTIDGVVNRIIDMSR